LDWCVKLLAVLHLLPSYSEITQAAHTGPHYHQRSGESTKTPFSLHINLITMQQSIAANRHVVNRFPCCPPWINPTTPCCVVLRRTRDLSLTVWQIQRLRASLDTLCWTFSREARTLTKSKDISLHKHHTHTNSECFFFGFWFIMPPHS